jgi:hypothetical protein
MFIKEGARISKGCNRIVEEVEELLRYAPTCTQLEELDASEVDICCGECSEAKDHLEQLSNVKECIIMFCMLLWPPFVWPQPGSVYMTYV